MIEEIRNKFKIEEEKEKERAKEFDYENSSSEDDNESIINVGGGALSNDKMTNKRF